MKFVEEREKNPLVPGHYYLFNWIKPFIKSKSKILDIGCWSGALEILFEKEDCHVTGIDLEPEPIEYARKRFPNFRFEQASIIQKLPFEEKEFDIALYFMVIEHIPKGTELTSLININRVLKPGGQLFFNTMHHNLVSNLIDPAYFTGHRHYSQPHLELLLKEAGFEIKEVKYNAGYGTTLYIVILYFFKHVLRRPEPRNKFLDKLMEMDYRDKGFVEIDIRAEKIKDL